MKEKLIFLDIDGVLNSELYARRFFDEKLYKKDPQVSNLVDSNAVQLVLKIIKETNAKLIISSSWRSLTYKHTIEDFKQFKDLSPLLPFIYGVTPPTRNAHRGEEIKYFLNFIRKQDFREYFKEPISNNYNYVILDDDSDMLEEQLPNFVKVTYWDGITEKEVEKCINILNKE